MPTPQLLTPTHWNDYELIDCGNFEKLERFGPYIIARPEPQAMWSCSLTPEEWTARAHARFVRDRRSDERGEWVLRSGMPEQWMVGYEGEGWALKMRLGLTAFKHVGLFPEQAENWEFIVRETHRLAAQRSPRDGEPATRPAVLNLFAYTGGASLAACAAGADVTHVDSVKPVVSWARENMEASGLQGIRWIVDDALKFTRRECKRGRRYDGIILDPPAYGRGAAGEKWVLEEQIGEMLSLCGELLCEEGFLVLNLYSMGLSALLARSAVRQMMGVPTRESFGELYFDDSFGKSLPLGVYYRAVR